MPTDAPPLKNGIVVGLYTLDSRVDEWKDSDCGVGESVHGNRRRYKFDVDASEDMIERVKPKVLLDSTHKGFKLVSKIRADEISAKIGVYHCPKEVCG